MVRILPSAVHPINEDVIRDWLFAWSTLWRTPVLAIRVGIVFNPRLRAALGRCTPSTYSIRLNAALLDADPAIVREVLCHEAAHEAAWILHGRVRPHGREWQDLMRAAGYEPRVRWPVQAPPGSRKTNPRPPVLYLHACPVCGAGRTARRPVGAWRCTRCIEDGLEGRLELTSWPAAGKGKR